LKTATSPDSAAGSLSGFIWRTRYRDAWASPAESTLADTWERVAHAVAAIERLDALGWEQRFHRLLADFRFLPGGRILAGAGVTRHLTLASCFVMGPIEDSINGIFEALKEGALTLQQGGGVGYDFSTLRPRGSLARTTGAVASGPVSFLQLWDAMCATILFNGARRGAMMATLRCDHPDILELLEAKQTPGRLPRFNISVLVTDAFMQAVARDEPWPLVFPDTHLAGPAPGERTLRSLDGGPARPVRVWKVVGARQLWQRLCASAQACAEPGVLFIDRINAENNLAYAERLSATNPCAEEPLPPYGACNLGSLNLAAFVHEPFTAAARLDTAALRDAARLAVRFLDNVIEISRFPLPQQRREAQATRRIGLGITGLADALAMLGLSYGAPGARRTAAGALRTIRDAAYEASIELAGERGPFERFDAQRYLQGAFVRRLPVHLQTGIRQDGIRNSHLLAIAPAGTISLLAGNLSSGIEPIAQLTAGRRVLDVDGTQHLFHVTDRAYALWETLEPSRRRDFPNPRPASWRAQLLMQAALQRFVDGSISKTIALASDAGSGTVEAVFRAAHRLGLKGCTVFRETARSAIIAPAEPSCVDGAESPAAHCCDLDQEVN
jgi:ribonucleoside-diphosphate reductase alpha chain